MHPIASSVLALALAACLAPASAQAPAAAEAGGRQALRPAENHRAAPSSFLEQFDEDKDGKVDAAAFEAFRRARYAATDEDGDGSVDVEEYVNEYAGRLDRSMEAARAGQVRQTHTRFAALDRDRDGYVSRAEYDASGERAYAAYLESAGKPQAPVRMGVASRDPIGMPTTHSRAGMLAMYDRDGDGEVPRAEYDAGRAEAFARIDADGDGRLDKDEYLAEFEDRLDRQIAARREAALQQARVRFGALDAGKDGRVSWDEYAASGKRLFERADVDGNGTVDAADAAAAPPPPAAAPHPHAPAAAAR
ncbi:hypothetical protein B1992_06950 [Pseudoxanthomonas broegbernensis]|uniref:EF-hand domain-containing protein n=1 Tax=Pseudoxanthomonas broegbernensis TaxID=83619 RepID=A0A7V8GMY6_9GAMM|nr:EF-hand domain-containing protein [Pseudoxanthomonas broegbernensis]KAF1686640.1 hypothetical protein B1992_06950 [Pseudoxanthomonas broegbernensis]MBB6063604.1 Ca2+-binding EF-hand superfamily protein [Pseudoxanthomonas broegbernensis]